MKEKLLKRLEEMNKLIDETHKRLQQANADLNMLNGHRAELVNVINMLDQPEEVKEPALSEVTNDVNVVDQEVAA